MKTCADFFLRVLVDMAKEDHCPDFYEFMDWIAVVIDGARDEEAKTWGMFYIDPLDRVYFKDKTISLWKFCELAVRTFERAERIYGILHD